MHNSIHQPHDKLFKKAMTDFAVAREFFTEHLPEALLQQIDFQTLTLENNSFIDEVYKTSEADIVYSANCDGEKAYLYLLCEHQTSIDGFMGLRLQGYLIRLLEMHHKKHPKDHLPLVYPLVVYSGENIWTAPLDFFELFGHQKNLMEELWLKPYQLIDICRFDDQDLRKHQLSGLLKFVLKYRQTKDLEQFLQTLFPWVSEVEIEQGSNFSRIVLYYVLNGIEAKDIELFLIKQNNAYRRK